MVPMFMNDHLRGQCGPQNKTSKESKRNNRNLKQPENIYTGNK